MQINTSICCFVLFQHIISQHVSTLKINVLKSHTPSVKAEQMASSVIVTHAAYTCMTKLIIRETLSSLITHLF